MRQVLVPRDVAPAIALRAPGASIVSLGGETMGTTWSVKFVESERVSTAQVQRTIEVLLDSVIREMSPWIAGSDITRFNNAAPGTWHAMPADFIAVLRCALSAAELSGGAYDPTAGALVDLWGFGPHGSPRKPNEAAIAAARETCGWTRPRLDDTRVFQPGGLRLDFSSIAKGFAVDKISAHLVALGITDHLVEIGGELAGQGIKPGGSPWWVALEQPHGEGRARETIVALHNLSIATSGDSQRFFEHDGRRYSHTIDPRSGYPVSGLVTSVTVLHRHCMWADTLSTALLVLGPEAGFALAKELNLAARFVLRHPSDIEQRLTPAMAAMLD